MLKSKIYSHLYKRQCKAKNVCAVFIFTLAKETAHRGGFDIYDNQSYLFSSRFNTIPSSPQWTGAFAARGVLISFDSLYK